MSDSRDYNAIGILRVAACAANLVSMIAEGCDDEFKDAVAALYKTAITEFPLGPLKLRDDLNRMCTELDLPLIMAAKQKDSGEVL